VVTGIAFLMAAKIPLVSSLVAISIAVVLGLIFSVSVWSRTAAAAAKG
jgi:hypothetical protein